MKPSKVLFRIGVVALFLGGIVGYVGKTAQSNEIAKYCVAPTILLLLAGMCMCAQYAFMNLANRE